jgi:hypothetical protein
MAGSFNSLEPPMTDLSNTPQPPRNPPACTRATPRQGTSYMAFRHEPLDPDDPLLGFRPVPHKQPRRNAITPARQRAFVAALAECGIVTQAARKIGASTEALYKLRNRPGAEEFSAAWDLAVDRGVMRLEDTALARAIEGEERMVVSGGKHMGTEIRFNENLVMFFLRNRRGERYAPDWRALRPGHPVYDRIAAEAVAAYRAGPEQEEEAATLASLDAFFEGLKQRRLANEAVLAEHAAKVAEEEEARAERARSRPPGEADGEDAAQ